MFVKLGVLISSFLNPYLNPIGKPIAQTFQPLYDGFVKVGGIAGLGIFKFKY